MTRERTHHAPTIRPRQRNREHAPIPNRYRPTALIFLVIFTLAVGMGIYVTITSVIIPFISEIPSVFPSREPTSVIRGVSGNTEGLEFQGLSGRVANETSHSGMPGTSAYLQLMSMPISDIIDTGYMVLVNREKSLPVMPLSSSLVSAWPTVPVLQVDGMYLHATALSAIEAMFASARAADVGSFFVSSGFRGRDAQYELYNSGMDRAYVLPPGHSEHHTGLAVDILAVGLSQDEMGNSREGHWLAENSYRFGLILRYPQGAAQITGIEFEPWHFRYVGKPHAYFMQQNNLLLEEYIELLRDRSIITFEKGSKT